MPRKYNIRWKDADNDELNRVVKNFNAKISRMEKKDPKAASALPNRASVRELRNVINTRQDLKRELNALKRFSNIGAEELVIVPGNEYELKTTRWQKNEMSQRIGYINRKRNQRRKDLEEVSMKSRGQDLGYKKSDIGMGKADEIALRPMKAFTPKMTRADLNEKFKNIRKESSDAFWIKKEMQLKENYLSGLKRNYSESEIAGIQNAIEKMSFKEFYQNFEAEGGTFEHIYFPDENKRQDYLSSLTATWNPTRKTSRSKKRSS